MGRFCVSNVGGLHVADVKLCSPNEPDRRQESVVSADKIASIYRHLKQKQAGILIMSRS